MAGGKFNWHESYLSLGRTGGIIATLEDGSHLAFEVGTELCGLRIKTIEPIHPFRMSVAEHQRFNSWLRDVRADVLSDA